MIRRPPRSTRTDTLFPYTTLFRSALQATLRATLPDLSINLGGTTSIDVTRAGVDKGYGLKRLSAESGVPLDGMLFIGDAIFPGGNDYPAAEIGLDTVDRKSTRLTPVTNAHLVCRLLLEKKNNHTVKIHMYTVRNIL